SSVPVVIAPPPTQGARLNTPAYRKQGVARAVRSQRQARPDLRKNPRTGVHSSTGSTGAADPGGEEGLADQKGQQAPGQLPPHLVACRGKTSRVVLPRRHD